MTDKQWDHAMAQIESFRFQLTHNIMSANERVLLKYKLIDGLRHLADCVANERVR